jgi:endonuclease G
MDRTGSDRLAAAILALLGVVLLGAWLRGAPARALPVEQCGQHVPFGPPASVSPTRSLCRHGYLAGYSGDRRIALWVAERLTPASAWGCGERWTAFRADPELPRGQRAETGDYRNSGYDKGHLANSANHLGDAAAQEDSFLLSNAAPQGHTLNAGLWFRLEVLARVWAHDRGDLQVISGPVLEDDDLAIGANGIPVPSAFWKVLVDPRTRETLAFLVPHRPLGWSADPARYVVPLAAVEAMTGLTLPRPEGWAVRPEAVAPWPGDLRSADDLRAVYCPG